MVYIYYITIYVYKYNIYIYNIYISLSLSPAPSAQSLVMRRIPLYIYIYIIFVSGVAPPSTARAPKRSDVFPSSGRQRSSGQNGCQMDGHVQIHDPVVIAAQNGFKDTDPCPPTCFGRLSQCVFHKRT